MFTSYSNSPLADWVDCRYIHKKSRGRPASEGYQRKHWLGERDEVRCREDEKKKMWWSNLTMG